MFRQSKPQHARSAEHRSNCLVCSSPRLTRVFRIYIYGYSVSHCRDCGSRFLNPPPNEATQMAILLADSVTENSAAESDAKMAQLKVERAKQYLRILSQFVGREGGKLLDVGCGRGELLLEAQSRGFEVAGIDASPHAATTANRRLGDEVVSVGTIESLSPARSSFDMVMLADVLDHIREPLPFLQRVYNLLEPGGVVMVATPSLDSWSARLMRRYWMEYMPQHTVYFSNRSLKLALEGTGFGGVTLVPDVEMLDLDHVCRRFQRFPVPVVTPVLRLARKWAPEKWASREVQLVTSGVVAIARKPNVPAVPSDSRDLLPLENRQKVSLTKS